MSAWLPQGRMQWISALAGVVLLGGLLVVGFAPAQERLLSYLFCFLFFTGISIGSLALVMVHVLSGGAWGELLRQPLLAAARTLPLQALLAIPILAGLPALYPWARPDASAHDPMLREQSWYLAPTFFAVRTVIYFVLWIGFLWLIGASAREGRTRALPRIASGGLIVYALSSLFAATDWAMSLLPHWHSSTFGLMVATGWMLAAAALAMVCALLWIPARAATADLLHDLGNLLLMFVLAWSYLAFMQYLTVWIADLPAETAWYIPRTLSSWRALALFLIAFHFAVPFAVLLSRRAKRRTSWLAGIAALLLIAHLADAFWLVIPTFRPRGFAIRGSDVLAFIGMGALWCSLYFSQLRSTRWAAWSMQPAADTVEGAHG